MSNYGVSSTYGVRSNYGVLDDEGVRPNYGIGSGDSWSPANLFGPNDVGLWYDYAAITPEMLAWRRNLLLRSEEFDNAAWTKTNCTVTANAIAAPDGALTADSLTATAGSGNVVRPITFTGDGEKCASIFVKQGTGAFCDVSIVDNTAGVSRHRVRVTFGGGTATLSTGSGAGTLYPVEVLANGWLRILFSATGIVAANTNQLFIYPDGTGAGAGPGTAMVYVWGAQAENSSSPSAYQRITDFTSDFVAAFPTTAIYQDIGGITPISALGQPVGLILDKSRGGAANLGPELVTNGDFSSGTTGWAASANATITAASGGMRVTNIGSVNGYGYQSLTTVAGRMYSVSVDVSIETASTGLVQIGPTIGSITLFSQSRGTSGRIYGVFVASGATTVIHVVNSTTNNASTLFDNISVREVPGNHAIQSTPTARPVWDARKNQIIQTQDFNNAYWVKSGQGVGLAPILTANFGVAPDGTQTAWRVQYNVNGGTTSNDRSQITTAGLTGLITFAPYTASIYVKPLDSTTDTQLLNATFFGSLAAGGNVPVRTLQDVGNGWKRIQSVVAPSIGVTTGTFRLSVHGDTGPNTMDVLVWAPQLEYGSTATSYQRVTTATDYADVGFSRGALFDGSDDFLRTAANLDFTSTDKVTVIAGVDKRSDVGSGVVAELSANSDTNNGSWSIFAPGNAGQPNIYFSSRGTALSSVTVTGQAAPVSRVVSGLGDISADGATLRINGAVSGTSATDQGTGNYGSYLLYMGRRGGVSAALNGRITQLIIIGRVLTTAELAQVERYVATQSGVLIP